MNTDLSVFFLFNKEEKELKAQQVRIITSASSCVALMRASHIIFFLTRTNQRKKAHAT